MTTITATGNAFDMTTLDLTGVDTGTVSSHSATQFVVAAPASITYTFTGSSLGSYDGSNVPHSGTITKIVISGSFGTITIQNFSMNVNTFYDFVHSHDTTGFEQLLLAGNDTITGTPNNDVLVGYGGDDNIRGGAGNDTLHGGDGNDVLNGGAGVDTLDGGDGIDRVSFSDTTATQGAIADLRTGIVTNDGFGNSETLNSIEGIAVGTAFADKFYLNDLDNTIASYAGDTVHTYGGNDTIFVGGSALVDGGDGVDGIDLVMSRRGLSGVESADHGAHISLQAGLIYDDGFGGTGQVQNVENIYAVYSPDPYSTSLLYFNDTLTGNNVNNVIKGYDGDDVLTGLGGNDSLHGGAENDKLYGGDGNDTLVGDETSDLFVGNDLLNGGTGNDTLIGGGGLNLLIGGTGNDTLIAGFAQLHAGYNYSVMNGGDGVDSFDASYAAGAISFADPTAKHGASVDLGTQIISDDGFGNREAMVGVDNIAIGTVFADKFYGNDFANNIVVDKGDIAHAYAGNDHFTIYGAPALIDGGTDYNYAEFSGVRFVKAAGQVVEQYATHGVRVDLSHHKINDDGFGGHGLIYNVQYIAGSTFADSLLGDVYSNTLHGLGGDDVLKGREGDDRLDGGAGNDLLSGGSGADHLLGGDGNDALYGGAGGDYFNDYSAYASGNDVMWGGRDNDSLQSRDGRDFLFGGGGNDQMYTLSSYAVLNGGNGADRISDFSHNAIVSFRNVYGTSHGVGVSVSLALENGSAAQNTGQGADILYGFENLHGSQYSDRLTGDDQDNVIIGGGGNDKISGAGGNDILEVSQGDNVVDGGDGTDMASWFGYVLGDSNDTLLNITGGVTVSLMLSGAQDTGQGMVTLTRIEGIEGTQFDDTLTGNCAANTIYGDSGNDTIDGNDGDDFLFGDHGIDWREPVARNFEGTGNDTINGGIGNDFIAGGAGSDTLTGGTGSDTFAFFQPSDSVGSTFDSIQDFQSGTDKIQLWFSVNAIDASISAAHLSDLETAADASHLQAHDALLADVNSQTYLVVDANGVAGYQAGQDLLILMANNATIQSSDFTAVA